MRPFYSLIMVSFKTSDEGETNFPLIPSYYEVDIYAITSKKYDVSELHWKESYCYFFVFQSRNVQSREKFLFN